MMSLSNHPPPAKVILRQAQDERKRANERQKGEQSFAPAGAGDGSTGSPGAGGAKTWRKPDSGLRRQMFANAVGDLIQVSGRPGCPPVPRRRRQAGDGDDQVAVRLHIANLIGRAGDLRSPFTSTMRANSWRVQSAAVQLPTSLTARASRLVARAPCTMMTLGAIAASRNRKIFRPRVSLHRQHYPPCAGLCSTAWRSRLHPFR